MTWNEWAIAIVVAVYLCMLSTRVLGLVVNWINYKLDDWRN